MLKNRKLWGASCSDLKFHDADKQQVADNIQNELWSTKALVPVMDWKGGLSPQSPPEVVESLSNGNKLTWIDNDDNTAYYAIYRINKGDSIDINSDNSVSRLIETVRKGNKDLQEFIDKGIMTSIKWNMRLRLWTGFTMRARN